MGSMINLGVGGLELDWGKNSFFRNHSALFMPGDVAPAPYYYADGVIEHQDAFVRPLRSVVRRLEMLGYTLAECERQYQEALSDDLNHYSRAVLTFEEFARVVRNVNVRAVIPADEGDYDLGEYVAQAIMRDPEFTKTDERLGTLSTDSGTFFENLDPYVTLRLLGTNPANLDEAVVWRFADVVEGGWVERDALYEGVPASEVCLVVTEGSSDGLILRHALPVVAPDVADFFDFVDMTENYPFTGAGNLYRFCQGLARIRIQNRILVVLDNDTTGRETFQRIAALNLPPRMRVAILPRLEECTRMRTVGPSGGHVEDVNGRAVAIECFLDLQEACVPEPVVRWTGYNAALDAYQGELLRKDEYTRRFLEAATRRSKYDYSKLSVLWQYLTESCSAAA
jgi:hypothetical protein